MPDEDFDSIQYMIDINTIDENNSFSIVMIKYQSF